MKCSQNFISLWVISLPDEHVEKWAFLSVFALNNQTINSTLMEALEIVFQLYLGKCYVLCGQELESKFSHQSSQQISLTKYTELTEVCGILNYIKNEIVTLNNILFHAVQTIEHFSQYRWIQRIKNSGQFILNKVNVMRIGSKCIKQ